MTTESCNNDATTLYRMNFSRYVAHATIFCYISLNAYYSVLLVVGLVLGLRYDRLWIRVSACIG